MTEIPIKINGKEKDQIEIPEKFEDNLPLPDNFDYSSLNEDDNDNDNEKDNELFKSSKYFSSTQPTIFSYFKKLEEESWIWMIKYNLIKINRYLKLLFN